MTGYSISIIAAIVILLIITMVVLLYITNAKNRMRDYYERKLEAYEDALDQVETAYHNLIDLHSALKDELKEKSKITYAEREIMEKLYRQVGDAIASSPIWGSPEESPFPGATSIMVGYSPDPEDDEMNIIIRGRTFFEETKQEAILNEPSIARKFSMAARSLELQGVYDRIARQLTRTPAIAYTLAMDEDGKLYVAYQLTVRQQKEISKVNLPDHT